MKKDRIIIYSDGACSGNPGPGGYGTIIVTMDKKGNFIEKELSKGYEYTTNNIMEIKGIIRGLEEISSPSIIDVYSDSKYVIDAINKGWVYNWKEHDWVKSNGKEAKNVKYWKKLLNLMSPHTIKFHWVRGHASNIYNNRCDKLAVEARLKIVKGNK